MLSRSKYYFSGAIVALWIGVGFGCGGAVSPAGENCRDSAFENQLIAEAGGHGAVRISQLGAVLPDGQSAAVGGALSGVAGDWLLQNSKIRAVVQKSGYSSFVGTYGGTLIDADVLREDGLWHDVMGEIIPLIGLNFTLDATRFEVLADGSSGRVVLKASGVLRPMEFINIPFAMHSLSRLLIAGDSELQLKVPWEMGDNSPLIGANYFVLDAEAEVIHYHTTLCNTADQPVWTAFVDAIDSGGTVSYFNTAQTIKGEPGFGVGDPINFVYPAGVIGYLGTDSGYGLRFQEKTGIITYAGLSFALLGNDNPVAFLSEALIGLSPNRMPEGYIQIPAYGTHSWSRDVLVFKEYNAMRQIVHRQQRIDDNARIAGRILRNSERDSDTSVALVNAEGELMYMSKATAEGAFEIQVAPGTYTVYAGDALGVGAGETITVLAHENKDLVVQAADVGWVSVQVSGTTSALSSELVPLPAKVSFVCVQACTPGTRLFADTLYDHFPEGVQLQAMSDLAGKLNIMAKRGYLGVDQVPLPPGEYDIIVSHGMEYTLYSQRITLTAGSSAAVQATLYRSYDTPGWISADLHVHTVNSPDAAAPLQERVLTFAGEGVEILVTTDHDFITDLAPTIEKLGMQKELHSIMGEELTLFDFGHFNAYPLRREADQPLGGAVDAYGGRGPSDPPQKFLATLAAQGSISAPVVQVNHPRSTLFGYFSAIDLNTATLRTTADPRLFRVDPAALSSSTQDTGLYADKYNAFELYNVYGEITPGLNDLFALLNIGIRRTAVADSDTHKWYAEEAGVPRSFVYVGPASDIPSTVTDKGFAAALIKGQLIGSNGPWISLEVKDQLGAWQGIGTTVTPAQPVQSRVRISLAPWVFVDTLELFWNTPDVASSGRPLTTYPQFQKQIRLSAADFSTAPRSTTAEIRVPLPLTEDAWLVAVVRDDKDYGTNHSMVPMLANPEELSFAFTNPVFVDTDRNGRYQFPGQRGGIQKGGSVAIPLAAGAGLTANEIQQVLRAIP